MFGTRTGEEVTMKKIIALLILGLIILPHVVNGGEWYEKFKAKADFRLRHEMIQEESKEDRTRWRFRFRLSLTGEVNSEWAVHTRLATGSSGPVSTNQTIDGGFSTKGFQLDQAYFDYHPEAFPGLKIIGGKMKMPLMVMEKTELIWDGDLTPEGAALMLKRRASDKITAMLNGAFFYVEERKADDDTWMAGGQAALDIEASDNVDFVIGGGYYDYQNVEGFEGIYDSDDFGGNTHESMVEGLVATDGYAWDFNLFEVFGGVSVGMENRSFKAYGNYVTNTGADSCDSGWLIGGTFAHGKDKGHFKVYGTWREIESDAVIGAFTDSDFRGGGTDGSGLEVGVRYGAAKKVDLGLTYFLNDKGIDEEVEYKRLQADLKLGL